MAGIQLSQESILAVTMDLNLTIIQLKSQLSEIVAQNNNLTKTIEALEKDNANLRKEKEDLKKKLPPEYETREG